jgi:hypothetical protein
MSPQVTRTAGCGYKTVPREISFLVRFCHFLNTPFKLQIDRMSCKLTSTEPLSLYSINQCESVKKDAL